MEKVEPLKDKGGNSCLEAENVGEILSEYYAMVFNKEKDMEDSEICVEHANMLGHFEIKKEVVSGLLKSVKVDKSPGPNGIYSRQTRGAREEKAGALTKSFLSSLATREVPEGCQVTNVVPLFKGNRDNPGNNRPRVEGIGRRVFFRLEVSDQSCSARIRTGTLDRWA
eukprot:g39759.t1